jgi:hypothetical protein
MTRNGPKVVEAVYRAMKSFKGMRFTASELYNDWPEHMSEHYKPRNLYAVTACLKKLEAQKRVRRIGEPMTARVVSVSGGVYHTYLWQEV